MSKGAPGSSSRRRKLEPNIHCERSTPWHRLSCLPAAGPRYPQGLPIWPETELEAVIAEQRVDRCLLSYSDLPYSKVMELAGRCAAAGAGFELAAPARTWLPSCKPVVAVCAVRGLEAGGQARAAPQAAGPAAYPPASLNRQALCRPLPQVRTGCGKSQVSRYLINELQRAGKKCVLVRHPMVSPPSGDGVHHAQLQLHRCSAGLPGAEHACLGRAAAALPLRLSAG